MACCLIPADLMDDEFEQLVIAYFSYEHMRIYASLTNHLLFEAAVKNLEFHYFMQQRLISISGQSTLVLHTPFAEQLREFLEERRSATVAYEVRADGHSARLLLCDMQAALQYSSQPPEPLEFGTLKFSLQGVLMQVYRRMGSILRISFENYADADGAFAAFMFLKHLAHDGPVPRMDSSICPDIDRDLESCESALRASGPIDRYTFKRRVMEAIGRSVGEEGSGDDYCEVEGHVSKSAELVQFSNVLFTSQARNVPQLSSSARQVALPLLETTRIYADVLARSATKKQSESTETEQEDDTEIEIDLNHEEVEEPRPKSRDINNTEAEYQTAEEEADLINVQDVASNNAGTDTFSREQFYKDLEMLEIGLYCQNLKGKPAFIRFRAGDALSLVVQAGCRNINDVVNDIYYSGPQFALLCAEKTYEYKAHESYSAEIARAVRYVLHGIEIGERREDSD